MPTMQVRAGRTDCSLAITLINFHMPRIAAVGVLRVIKVQLCIGFARSLVL